MAETTATLALELGKSERQVLNYKKAVEKHLGFSVTTKQGKQHFYNPQFVDLIRVYAKRQPLPKVPSPITLSPPIAACHPKPHQHLIGDSKGTSLVTLVADCHPSPYLVFSQFRPSLPNVGVT
jgi:hypothetical protein